MDEIKGNSRIEIPDNQTENQEKNTQANESSHVSEIAKATSKIITDTLSEVPKKRYEIEITTTKRGIPALWESGGGLTNRGHSQIITGRNGEAPRPVYVPRGGPLACGDHALIPIHQGYYIVKINVYRGVVESGRILKVISTTVKDIDGEKWQAKAIVEEVNSYDKGEWSFVFDEKFAPAFKAAKSKAFTYHCRGACYIDTTSPKKELSEAEKQRRKAEMEKQDLERARLRKAAEDKLKAAQIEAENQSRSAKENGMGAALEALNIRREKIGERLIELKDTTFVLGRNGYSGYAYTYDENNLMIATRDTKELEQRFEEAEKLKLRKEIFVPKITAFENQLKEIGFRMDLNFENVLCIDETDAYKLKYFEFSEDGVLKLSEFISLKRKEILEEKIRIESELNYANAKLEAENLGLPKDVRIWRRLSGSTDRGNGWVIQADGRLREATGTTDPYSRRYEKYGEGEMYWEQILKGEVVLKWSKNCTTAPHNFEVIHLPKEGLTEAQKEKIIEIENGIADEWEGRTGFSSGIESPSIGEAFGLVKRIFDCSPKTKDEPQTGSQKASIQDLLKKFR